MTLVWGRPLVKGAVAATAELDAETVDQEVVNGPIEDPDVVAEGLRGDIRLVAEGVVASTESIERLRSDVTREMNEHFRVVQATPVGFEHHAE